MNLRLRPALLLASLATLVGAPCSRALTEAEAATGRALVKQYADTVISLEVVTTLKVTVGDRAQPPRENKVEVNATVISPTGLSVTILSTIDPRGAMEAMAASRGPGGPKVEIGETEFKDVKLRLANNTEVPAVIVLKDPDLNLVFIAPLVDSTAPARTFPFVSLERAATAEVLGNYFFVTRAPKSLQRVPLVRTATINGIVEKPRRLYLVNDLALGVPVVDASGQVLGLGGVYLENGRPTSPLVLSTADVQELAAQAAAVKPEEKEKEESAQAAAPSPTPTPKAAAVPPATPAPAANPGVPRAPAKP